MKNRDRKSRPPRGPREAPPQGSAKGYVLSPETVRMLELGHPWVIADAHTRRWPKGRAGDVVPLVEEGGRLVASALLDPSDRVVARVLGGGAVRLDGAWVRGKLESALALRRAHLDLSDTSAWRLVNGEGDGLPGLTVDCWGEHLMIQLFSAGWERHLELIADALWDLLSPRGIYVKSRPQQTRELAATGEGKRLSRLLRGAPRKARFAVREGGLNFLVDLEEGLDTGLFLDHRTTRRELAGRLAGKSFLNLFAYTGAFSVAAAAAGASRVTSVDVSESYLERARENFAANDLEASAHEFLAADCFEALKDLRRQGRFFDVVFFDPPSFSTTRRSTFTTRGGTAELTAASLVLLPPGGLLVASSNHQKTDLADYLKELRRGALQAGCELRVIGVGGQPADFPYPVTFPEGRYLKVVLAVKG